jgi:hypothetical protein
MHAKNNGFAFVERLIDERPDGLRLFNSYEVEGSPGLAIILGETRYLESIWGQAKLRAGTTNRSAGPQPARWHWVWQLPSKRRTGLLSMFRPLGRVRGRPRRWQPLDRCSKFKYPGTLLTALALSCAGRR